MGASGLILPLSARPPVGGLLVWGAPVPSDSAFGFGFFWPFLFRFPCFQHRHRSHGLNLFQNTLENVCRLLLRAHGHDALCESVQHVPGWRVLRPCDVIYEPFDYFLTSYDTAYISERSDQS